ncbi:MAG: translation elongation factor Ts [Phycisphaerae bacterium]|jgi:elongation factor Ts|nr:translation elongation factor Ts [Phycisphaerae bacterium]
MAISAAEVKSLRDKTGLGMMDCKKALIEAGGDADKAVGLLRKRGHQVAAKKAGRTAKDGRIFSYIHHNGKVGVMVEVNCETDFVAKSDAFQTFLKDICLQICAARPAAVQREDMDPKAVEAEKEIACEQAKGKPENVIEKIVDGKLNKWFAEYVLLEQPFVKDDKQTINDVLAELTGKVGEKIVVKRFVRFELGE